MKGYIDTKEMLKRAYISLAEEALNKGEKRKDNVIRCCKCGECNCTLQKIHESGIYACTDCTTKRGLEETQKELKKTEKIS